MGLSLLKNSPSQILGKNLGWMQLNERKMDAQNDDS